MSVQREKPKHGEIRMETERLADGYRIRATMFLDPGTVYGIPTDQASWSPERIAQEAARQAKTLKQG